MEQLAPSHPASLNLCLLPPPAAAAAAARATAAAGDARQPAAARRSRPRTLTGLYESGEGRRREPALHRRAAAARRRFGLVIWRGDLPAARARARRSAAASALRLDMDGDETCAIEARIEGGHVAFPATLPPGCAYYCGARRRASPGALRQDRRHERGRAAGPRHRRRPALRLIPPCICRGGGPCAAWWRACSGARGPHRSSSGPSPEIRGRIHLTLT